jgi:VIT1/CCC1 family predicted Fe2+/Mn2+ transporter
MEGRLVSLIAFPVGAAVLCPKKPLIAVLSAGSLAFLARIGALAAKTGGAPVLKAAARVIFWGAMARGLTVLVGRLVGPVV